MATVTDLLKKTSDKKSPFKKVSYRPWESHFLLDDTPTKEEDGYIKAQKDKDRVLGEQESTDPKSDSNLVQTPIPSGNTLSSDLKEETDQKIGSVVVEEKPFASVDDSVLLSQNKSPDSISVSANILDMLLKNVKKDAIFTNRIKDALLQIFKRERHRDEIYVYCEAVRTLEIADELGVSYEIVSSLLTRLKSKGLVVLLQGKRGRGGYSVYAIPIDVVKNLEKIETPKD